ncbi:MAG: terminase family protein [Pseudomonadota bacterium]
MSAPIIQFLPYQWRWLQDASRFKIGMFSRQAGKTFTSCAEIVDDCIQAEMQRRRARWVILSRGERQAAEAIREGITTMTRAFFALYGSAAGAEGVDIGAIQDATDGTLDAEYKRLEVTFPGGSRITALPANPDTARGFSANVLLDEFAFHRDSRAIWSALFPVISKAGLKLRVISTPNGKSNRFYDLISGSDGTWSRHIVDIYQAVADGLDRDIEELRAGMADPDAWAQEYELQFLDEASSWLSYDLIAACEDQGAGLGHNSYQGGPCFVGVDIARRNDLFVIVVLEHVGDVLWAREIFARRRLSFAEQDAELARVFDRYRVVRCAMDQTGMGEKPVEDAQRRHGASRVEGVLFTGPRKLDLATVLKQRFESRRLRITAGDQALRADLHAVKAVPGATGAPRLVADSDANGHADRFWAMALATGAAESDYQPLVYLPVRRAGAQQDIDDDRQFGAGGFGARKGVL